jgi:polyamine oxidase
VGQQAGKMLTENLQDMSIREGLSVAGWNPDEMDDEMLARAYEWWTWGE